ncbi:Glutaredoxin [Trachipleistophora hominis]|uniref:Glutaredoxin n=1 Tax=Trachipleistophora hominis TaxID=72359 RepID=L7JTS1_TRAHO|nr:Glutaredoxin [Trachipleistophora hominis]
MKDCEDCVEAHKLMKEKNIDVKCACTQTNPILIDEIEKKHGHKTFPIIFVDGTFIGGYSDLKKKYGVK